ncbi:unnamed protein product [Rangifer tarandus platyrhynchus]|uniref:Uncharacterized protein n=2 Tax=Rangifer tarandus platyrhynchus TaxID=3082113 RepID=A0ABN8ZBP8_RANTA|nr:unnamed protein product [Rangifer tarandus platyrhynchus]
MRENQVRSLGREDPLEKEMAAHSSILAWRRRCLVGPWSRKELDMTERLHFNSSLHFNHCEHSGSFLQVIVLSLCACIYCSGGNDGCLFPYKTRIVIHKLYIYIFLTRYHCIIF